MRRRREPEKGRELSMQRCTAADRLRKGQDQFADLFLFFFALTECVVTDKIFVRHGKQQLFVRSDWCQGGATSWQSGITRLLERLRE